MASREGATAVVRVASAICCKAPETDTTELRKFEETWGLHCPDDLRSFWFRYGSGEGFVGTAEAFVFLRLYSAKDALRQFSLPEVRAHMPSGCAPIGDDGAGEMIVFVEGRGYGLLGIVHSGIEDYQHVADTLEGFCLSSERNTWFG